MVFLSPSHKIPYSVADNSFILPIGVFSLFFVLTANYIKSHRVR